MQPIRFLRLLAANVLEPLIRLAGVVGSSIGRDRHGVEMVIRGRLLAGSLGWRIGRRVEFCGKLSNICMGANVVLYGETWIDAGGPSGHVFIGAASHVDRQSILYGQGGLTIGANCAISSGVRIYSQSNHDALKDGTPVALQPTKYAPVAIEDGCWIGSGVTVLPGVRVGKGARIGAGAVVVNDVAPFSTAVGVPAKMVERTGRERQA